MRITRKFDAAIVQIEDERHYKSANDEVDTMKVVAFNGSARKNGNTTILIEKRKT